MAFPGIQKPTASGSVNKSDGAGNGTVEIKAADRTLVFDFKSSTVVGGDPVKQTSVSTGQIKFTNKESGGGKTITLYKTNDTNDNEFWILEPTDFHVFFATDNISQIWAQADVDDPAYQLFQSSGV